MFYDTLVLVMDIENEIYEAQIHGNKTEEKRVKSVMLKMIDQAEIQLKLNAESNSDEHLATSSTLRMTDGKRGKKKIDIL